MMKHVELLQAIMESTGWTQTQLASELGSSQPRVSNWLKGEVPRGDKFTAIIELWKRTSGGFEDNGEDADLQDATRAMLEGLQVAGVAEAGTFRAVDLYVQDEPRRVPITKDPRYPQVTQYAWEVRGDSADLADIRDGMYVIGGVYEDWVEYYGEVSTGRFVVVEQSRAEGAERELTVKEARVFSDRIELHPRSSNPKHLPIIVQHNETPDDDRVVRIVAVVLSSHRLFA